MSRSRCDECGKTYALTSDGTMRRHQPCSTGAAPKRKPLGDANAAREWKQQAKRHERAARDAKEAEMIAKMTAHFSKKDGPVFAAVKQNDADELRRALAGGHSLTDELPNGQQPLHYAVVNKKSAEITRLLLEAGADPNRWCGSFILCVPLHYAAGGGQEEVARLLLNHGADPHLAFNNPDTFECKLAHEMARENGHERTAALIEERLAPTEQAGARAPTGRAAAGFSKKTMSALELLEGMDKGEILEEANGMGAGRRVREGAPFLEAYAAALELPKPALVQALRAAPGELDPWWADVMEGDELAEIQPGPLQS